MVKTRLGGSCTFDENGYKRRAACVVFKDESEDQVLLITSRHYDTQNNWWLVPGGSIEPNEDPRCAAEREVFEESGVKGQILRSVGQVVNDLKMTRTWVFVMIVKDQWEQWDESKSIGRQRKWFSVDTAKDLLTKYKPVQVNYIELAKKRKGHKCNSLTDLRDKSCCRHLDNTVTSSLIPCGDGAPQTSMVHKAHQNSKRL